MDQDGNLTRNDTGFQITTKEGAKIKTKSIHAENINALKYEHNYYNVIVQVGYIC